MPSTGDLLTWNAGLGAPLQFEWVAPTAQTPQTVMVPIGKHAESIVSASAEVDQQSRALYLGRAGVAFVSATVAYTVMTPAAGPAWAELAICKGTPSGGAVQLSCLGYASVTAQFAAAASYQTAMTISGVSPGDHLWVVYGCSDGVQLQSFVSYLPDPHGDGLFLYAAGARPSTMAAPTAFAVCGTTIRGMWCTVFFSTVAS